MRVCRYLGQHQYPHVHIFRRADSRELIAKVRIDTCDVLEGEIPRALGGVVRTVILGNRATLLENWTRCRDGKHPYELQE